VGSYTITPRSVTPFSNVSLFGIWTYTTPSSTTSPPNVGLVLGGITMLA
jgi:hypothetical protein